MKTIVYIDGFNLYYRLKNTKPCYKWLDPLMLSKNLLAPSHDIVHIKYFTARIKDTPKDPSQSSRQEIYLSALRDIPALKIHMGKYKERQIGGLLLKKDPETKKLVKTTQFARISTFEEKESDVNIAIEMICDAYERRCESAVLISNDTDLKTPLRLLKRRFKLNIGVFSPGRSVHNDLAKYSRFHDIITDSVLSQSQLANPFKSRSGRPIHKPSSW